MGGRRPKPTAGKELAGNPGRRKLNKAEPKPKAGTPKVPAHLTKIAKAEWKRLAPELGNLALLTEVDRAAFEVYCETYATWVRAKKETEKGFTYEHNGLRRMKPEVKIAEQALRLLRLYAIEFGLTPSSRTRIAAGLADGAQPLLPGMPAPAADPAKAKLPALPPDAEEGGLRDEDYFAYGTRH